MRLPCETDAVKVLNISKMLPTPLKTWKMKVSKNAHMKNGNIKEAFINLNVKSST